jgi:hypothetical protein
MNQFWRDQINGPFGIGTTTVTVREAVDRLEQEGFQDSQGSMCRKMIWRRRFRSYWRAQDGAKPLEIEKK